MSKSTTDPRNAHSTDPALPGRIGADDGASGAPRAGPPVRGRRDDAKAGTRESHGSLASGGGYLGMLHRFVRDTRPDLSESETVREVQRLYWGEREGPAHRTNSVNASGSLNARYASRDATGADHLRHEPPWMAGATPVLFDVARAVRGSDSSDAHGGARVDAGSRRAPARAERARDRGAAWA